MSGSDDTDLGETSDRTDETVSAERTDETVSTGRPDGTVSTGRRRLLAAAGGLGTAGLAATSGCLGVLTGSEPARFTAGATTVPAATLSETGFEEYQVETVTTEREFSAAGQSRTVEAVNTLAEYDRALEVPGVGRYRAALYTAFTTPAVEVLGRTFNPVGDATAAEIADRALSRVESLESPTETGETATQFLGTETSVGLFETDATLVEGVDLEIVLHVTEPVRAGADFVVAVGAYPKLLPQDDAIETLLSATEHAETTPSG